MPFNYDEATNKEAIDQIISPTGVWRNISTARAQADKRLRSIVQADLPSHEDTDVIVDDLIYTIERCEAALTAKQTQFNRNPRIADVAAILQWTEVGTDREGYTGGRPLLLIPDREPVEPTPIVLPAPEEESDE